MTKKLKVQTPKGRFPSFTNEVQTGLHAASVLFHTKHPEDSNGERDFATMEFELHTEYARTEQQAVEALRVWCEASFGGPCTIA
jgi:hypothetical protein